MPNFKKRGRLGSLIPKNFSAVSDSAMQAKANDLHLYCKLTACA